MCHPKAFIFGLKYNHVLVPVNTQFVLHIFIKFVFFLNSSVSLLDIKGIVQL